MEKHTSREIVNPKPQTDKVVLGAGHNTCNNSKLQTAFSIRTTVCSVSCNTVSSTSRDTRTLALHWREGSRINNDWFRLCIKEIRQKYNRRQTDELKVLNCSTTTQNTDRSKYITCDTNRVILQQTQIIPGTHSHMWMGRYTL
jgi:hypothetical protein